MAYSFDTLVYSSSLTMFIAVLIFIFVYEYISSKSVSTLINEPKVAVNLNKKGNKSKQNKQQQTDKFG
jgi:hypothetical protein